LEDALLFDAAAGVDFPASRRSCAYVPARESLFPHMIVRNNIAFAAHRSPRLERTRRTGELLEKFELTEAAVRKPREISPSQRIAATLARAVASSPKLLLVDACGMDERLLRLTQEAHSGPILMVTDDLDLCCAAAQLVLIDNGRVVQAGPPATVLERPSCVEAARIVGIPNIFEGTIAALDPGRNSSRLEFEGFALNAPFIPGHFRGARINAAVDPARLILHSGDLAPQPNCIPAALIRVTRRSRTVRLEFAHGIFADVSHAEYEQRKDYKSWQVEFPPEALILL
jgi:molybdate transport system ATP-binding protein